LRTSDRVSPSGRREVQLQRLRLSGVRGLFASRKLKLKLEASSLISSVHANASTLTD